MSNNQYYETVQCYSFEALLTVMGHYDLKVAFRNRYEEYTYRRLCFDIQWIRIKLKDRFEALGINTNRVETDDIDQLVLIDIGDRYLFTVAYLSLLLDGYVAVLADEMSKKYMEIPEGCPCISETELSEYLSEKSSEDLNFSKNDRIDDNNICFREIEKCCVDSIYNQRWWGEDANRICTIVCSSGTTSVVKGVMLSQKNILSDCICAALTYRFFSDAIYLSVLPMSHMFGIVADLLIPLMTGATICYGMKEDFLRDLAYFNPTQVHLPPALLYTICDLVTFENDPAKVVGKKLQRIICSGAAVNKMVCETMRGIGIEVYSAYGLTECSPCVSVCNDNNNYFGSSGFVIPCCKVEIVDGEVVVSGDNVMKGYYNDVEATQRVLCKGRLFTGDLGYINEDGLLFITGRKSTMISFPDGTKVIPEHIENALLSISEVQECKVSKITDDRSVKLQIVVVLNRQLPCRKWENIKGEIVKLLIENGVYSKIISIEESHTALPKNRIGKLIRY